MNLYLPNEAAGSFIIDANISYTNGQPYYSSTSSVIRRNVKVDATALSISVQVAELGLTLVDGGNVAVNSTGNEIAFSLADIPERVQPYAVTLVAADKSGSGNQSYTAETMLYKLPARTDGGSVVRVDSLYGGLMALQAGDSSSDTEASWTPILPYSFYVSWVYRTIYSIRN